LHRRESLRGAVALRGSPDEESGEHLRVTALFVAKPSRRNAFFHDLNKPQRHPEEPPKARDRKGDAGVSKDGVLLLYRFS
jgi:hypothetical protein